MKRSRQCHYDPLQHTFEAVTCSMDAVPGERNHSVSLHMYILIGLPWYESGKSNFQNQGIKCESDYLFRGHNMSLQLPKIGVITN